MQEEKKPIDSHTKLDYNETTNKRGKKGVIMKKAWIDGICCEGCARDVKHVLESIYGISDVQVFCLEGYALFEGFVSHKVIEEALKEEGYSLKEIEKC